ncbi:hypothetical protein ACWDA7_39695 [Streptomyces sp. NPDC001156]
MPDSGEPGQEASKLELAMAHFNAFIDGLAGTLHTRPEGQGILDTVEQWLRQQAGTRDEFDQLHDRMLQANPQLKGLGGGRLADVIQDGARLLAEEQGRRHAGFPPAFSPPRWRASSVN